MGIKPVKSSTLYTLCGVLPLLIWSASPSVICHISYLPVFQLSMLMQAFSFVFTFFYLLSRKQLKKILRELPQSLVMVPFLISTQICYICAFRLAPPDHVDLINYLWPMMTVIGSSFLFSERLSATRAFGILLGFSSIILLGRRELFFQAFDAQFVLGYLFAFSAACCWTIYTLIGRAKKNVEANRHIGFHVGISAAVVFLFHWFFEGEFVPLKASDWLLVASQGALVYAVGYPLWWYGLEKGKFALLTSLSYLTPLLSVWILVLTGMVDWTLDLCAACMLVAVGSWLVNRTQKSSVKRLSDVVVFADFSQVSERDEWNAELIEDNGDLPLFLTKIN